MGIERACALQPCHHLRGDEANLPLSYPLLSITTFSASALVPGSHNGHAQCILWVRGCCCDVKDTGECMVTFPFQRQWRSLVQQFIPKEPDVLWTMMGTGSAYLAIVSLH